MGRWRIGILVAAAILLGSNRSVAADEIGLGVIFWSAASGSGFYETDLEDRFFKDDLVRGTSTSVAPAKYNLRSSNHDQFAVPLQLYYSPGFLPQLRFEAEHYSIGSDIQIASFSDMPNPTRIHLDELQGYKRTSLSGGISYGFVGFLRKDPVSALRLRLGYVRESTDFSINSIVFSTTSALVVSPTDNFWRSRASGPYLGADLVIPVYKRWAIAGSFLRSESLKGSLRFENLQLLPDSGGGIGWQWDRTDARVRMQRDLQVLAVRHYVTTDFYVSFGFRRVVYRTRYPGFISYLINNTAGTLSVLPAMEAITDGLLFYSEEKHERIGNTFFSFRKVFRF